MNTSRTQPAENQMPLARFLERIRHTVSHDMRTPLGTIVNYAAVLEANEGSDAEEVRDLGRRIRGNAQRAARMIQLLAGVVELASRPLRSAPTDLATLARSILDDAGARGSVLLAPGPRPTLADVDAEVLGFAWRAFVAVESDSAGKPVESADLIVEPERDAVVVELQCGSNAALLVPGAPTGAASVELSAFLRHNGGPGRIESSLGLGLAQELLIRHGGSMTVFGRPGSRSGIRVRLPVAA
jgi:signal transduction histidine kinase